MAGFRPSVTVEVELNGFGGGLTNLGQSGSGDVVSAAGITIRRGIEGSGPDDNVAGHGSVTFTLDNSTSNSGGKLGYYSLYNANKRTGWGLGIGCRIRLVDPATGTPRTRFFGRIDAIDPVPGSKRERYVRVTAVDWMDEAARWTLTPEIGEQLDVSGDAILTDIVAAMPFAPVSNSFDMGYENYPYALDSSSLSGQTALAEFKKLADSERGLIFVTVNGTLRYESRHARLLDTVSDWTLADADIQGLTLPSMRDEIINSVRVTIHPRIVDEDPSTILYNQTNTIEVAAGATKTLLGPFRDQVTGDPMGGTDVQSLVATTDYTANIASDGSSTDITSDFSIVVTAGASGAKFAVTNGNASTGFLTFLQLRGKGIRDKGTLQLTARDTGSITTNGEHVVDFDMPYQVSTDVGQGAADYTLSKYSTAFAQARTVTILGRNATVLTQMLQRDISDRLTISETVTGLNSAFFINGEELKVLPSGYVSVTYTLAPAADPFSGLYWILDTSTLGTSTIPAPF